MATYNIMFLHFICFLLASRKMRHKFPFIAHFHSKFISIYECVTNDDCNQFDLIICNANCTDVYFCCNANGGSAPLIVVAAAAATALSPMHLLYAA